MLHSAADGGCTMQHEAGEQSRQRPLHIAADSCSTAQHVTCQWHAMGATTVRSTWPRTEQIMAEPMSLQGGENLLEGSIVLPKPRGASNALLPDTTQ